MQTATKPTPDLVSAAMLTLAEQAAHDVIAFTRGVRSAKSPEEVSGCNGITALFLLNIADIMRDGGQDISPEVRSVLERLVTSCRLAQRAMNAAQGPVS